MAHRDLLGGEGYPGIKTMLDEVVAIHGNWVDNIMRTEVINGKFAPMSHSLNYTRDLIVSDGGLELLFRQYLIDKEWIHTPVAYMVAVAMTCGAEIYARCLHRMAFYFQHNFEHLVYRYHEENKDQNESSDGGSPKEE
jgi:hypothetical protein